MKVAELHCTRCRAVRQFEIPNRRWRYVFRVWLVFSGLSILLWPIATFDMFCMTPVLAVIPLALGPLHRFATEPPTCMTCGGTSSREVGD